jgi:hypothetical protein
MTELAVTDSRRARLSLQRQAATASGIILAGNVVAQAARAVLTVDAGRRTDFAAFAGASRLLLAGSRCLYCLGSLQTAESAYLGTPVAQPSAYLNPPLAALAFAPFAALPRELGVALYALALLAALGLGTWLFLERLACPLWPTLVGALGLPVAFAFAESQWDPLLFLAVTLALVLLERRPVVAGLLLSALAVKVQAIWLVPVLLVALGRWRVLLGMALGAILLAGTDVALLGPRWLDWPRAALSTGGGQEAGSLGLPALAALAAGAMAGFAAFAALALGATGTTLALRRRLRAADPRLAVAAAVAAGLLLAPHSLAPDMLLQVPALALAGRRSPRLALAAAAGLSAAYLLGTAGYPTPLVTLGLGCAVAVVFADLFRHRQSQGGTP